MCRDCVCVRSVIHTTVRSLRAAADFGRDSGGLTRGLLKQFVSKVAANQAEQPLPLAAMHSTASELWEVKRKHI